MSRFSSRFALFMGLMLLLVGTLSGVFEVRRVEASGTIYIRADGSIEPPDAPISTVDNVTYTLTDIISSDGDGIVVERDNIVIDGTGQTLQGNGNGIDLTERVNVTIKGARIRGFASGVYFNNASFCSIYENHITNNDAGIYLKYSSSNTISGNNITSNYNVGIGLNSSSNNKISHNNFVNNNIQVYSSGSANIWDDGYPSGGNYWSNYNGTDANHDGIGDTPYVIDANNTDHYPLMVQYVIPEFSSFLILPLFFIAMLLAVIIYKRKHPQNE
jgi:parallel beta-helix repeat protein